MYRIFDNKTGEILAVTTTEPWARRMMRCIPDLNQELEDGTARYVYEDCTNTSKVAATLIQLLHKDL